MERPRWVGSPAALTDDLAACAAHLGWVYYSVSPNKLHHLFLSQWVEPRPEARATPSTAQGTARPGSVSRRPMPYMQPARPGDSYPERFQMLFRPPAQAG